MSVNTQAFVSTAPKAGKSVDAGTGERGQTSSKDAAAAFQAVMQNMKKGDAAEEPSGKPASETADQVDGTAGDANGKTGAGKEQAPGPVAFSTSNLVDALRQASQNALSRKAKDGEGFDGVSEGQTDPKAETMLQSASAHVGLSLNVVLAGKPGQVSSAQAQTQPGAARMPAVLQGQANGLPAGDPDGPAQTGTSSLFAQFGVEPEAISDGEGRGVIGRSMLPEEAASTVKVLRQETHFAPNMRLSPAQQVGDQITTAVKDMASRPVSPDGGISAKAEGPVLKTLDIQLTPHELGTVKVSLRMVGDTVEVSLVTSRAQTAELLKHDRQMLDQMLRATGFKADAITIQAGDDRIQVQAGGNASGPQAQNQNGAAGGNPFDGQPQSSGNGAGQQNGRPGQNSREDAYQASEATRGTGHEEGSDVSLSDGIYL
ncbi:flagellar hook-length control protein FliK [Roseibium aggregatum]|uniref:flagellar hook-length control protein FliK n=1 Tax=Roseibium aggregatum TaxID=187304 RepID=UPI003A982D36